MVQTELVLCAGQEPVDIGPVHVQDQSAQEQGQGHDNRVVAHKEPGANGEGGGGKDRAQGDIPGEDGQDQKAAPEPAASRS